jgi:DNA-binding beta-propeller fold protein YncE
MRLQAMGIAVIAAALSLTLQLSAQNANNPIEIALLRWYQANTAAQFNTCAHPSGMTFDGAHIWVACPNDNEIQELNANDGAQVRIVTGILNPYFLLFDGANIWVSNYGYSTVTEVNASTGMTVGTPVPVGSYPVNMTFDGVNVWVMNSGSNSVTKVPVSNPTAAVTYSFSSGVCDYPWGAAYDGARVWVSCHYDNWVLQLDSSANVLTKVCVGPYPAFMAFDGSNIWVTIATTSGRVGKVSILSPPACPTNAPSVAVGSYPEGIAFDTEYIWVANSMDNTVTKILASTLTVVGSPFSVPAQPIFGTFDGGNMWVSSRGGGMLSKM